MSSCASPVKQACDCTYLYEFLNISGLLSSRGAGLFGTLKTRREGVEKLSNTLERSARTSFYGYQSYSIDLYKHSGAAPALLFPQEYVE